MSAGFARASRYAQRGATRKYFAYGLNMEVAGMAARCPDARMLGRASLPGWQFRINRAGLATLVPCPRSKVHGVLWDINRRGEAALDAFEDVHRGLYRKDAVALRHASRVVRAALVYIACDDRPGCPLPGYLEAVLAAARFHRLPDAYLRGLALGYLGAL